MVVLYSSGDTLPYCKSFLPLGSGSAFKAEPASWLEVDA
jgi:hypothetical protein